MEGFGEFIKKHPFAIVGGVGALLLIYLYASSGSSTAAASSAYPPPPTDAEVQAAAQVQTGQLQLQAQSNQYAAQLAAQQDTNAANVTVAGLQAQTANYQVQQTANSANLATSAQADVSKAGIVAQENVSMAGQQTQQIVAGLQTQLGEAQLEAGTNAAIVQAATSAQLGAYGLAAQQSNNAALVDVTMINAARNSTPATPSTTSGGTVDYGSSISGLEAAISSTGNVGSGLLPEVTAAAAGGANASTWGTISGIVQNWASRTTNKKNQAGKNTVLNALNLQTTPVTTTPGTPGTTSFTPFNLLPVS